MNSLENYLNEKLYANPNTDSGNRDELVHVKLKDLL